MQTSPILLHFFLAPQLFILLKDCCGTTRKPCQHWQVSFKQRFHPRRRVTPCQLRRCPTILRAAGTTKGGDVAAAAFGQGRLSRMDLTRGFSRGEPWRNLLDIFQVCNKSMPHPPQKKRSATKRPTAFFNILTKIQRQKHEEFINFCPQLIAKI